MVFSLFVNFKHAYTAFTELIIHADESINTFSSTVSLPVLKIHYLDSKHISTHSFYNCI